MAYGIVPVQYIPGTLVSYPADTGERLPDRGYLSQGGDASKSAWIRYNSFLKNRKKSARVWPVGKWAPHIFAQCQIPHCVLLLITS